VSRRLSFSVLLLLSACGRLGFAAPDGEADAVADASIDPLTASSDEFDSDGLRADWTIENPSFGSASVASGTLVLQPRSIGQWFEDGVGLYVWLDATGDFVATARVRITDAMEPPGPPAGPGLEVASIMVRDPASVAGAQNHSWVGVVAEGGTPSKESKDTTNSSSVYVVEAFPSPSAQLRLCRVGSTLRTFHAPYDGGAWIEHQVYDRPDLPVDIQLGVTATENGAPADITATFDWIRFRTPSSVADCTTP